MKTWFARITCNTIALAVTAFFLALTVSFLPVHAASVSDIAKRLDADIQKSNDFIDKISAATDSEAALAIIEREAQGLITYFGQSAAFYEDLLSKEKDKELRTMLDKLAKSAAGLRDSLEDVLTAIETGNVDLYDDAFIRYDQHIDTYNSVGKQINEKAGFDYGPFLAVSFWISLALSGGLLIISFVKQRGQQLRNKPLFHLFKSSLWPFIGSTISYVWYLNTPPGGTYYFLWGPILFGYVAFLRQVYEHFANSKTQESLPPTIDPNNPSQNTPSSAP